MAHVARSGEVTTGRGRTAVRIGWLEREPRGWQARPSIGPDRSPVTRTQYPAVRWLYAYQAAQRTPWCDACGIELVADAPTRCPAHTSTDHQPTALEPRRD